MMVANCLKCGLPLLTAHHICIHRIKDREPPILTIIDSSEIYGEVDLAGIGVDGVPRPVLVHQDDGQSLMLTARDAERLHFFLTAALEYVGMNDFKKV